MTIIWSKKVTPATVARIKKSDAFVAIITEAFVKEEKRYYECKIAEKVNKPMYAIVEVGVNWDMFEEIPWRKVYYYEKGKKTDYIVTDIEKDLKWYKSTGA